MILLLVVGSSVANAGDYIRLGVDLLAAGTQNAEIPFHIQRQCEDPPLIGGATNGFVLTATGSATWSFVDFVPDSICAAWWNLVGLLFTNKFNDASPDSFLAGGAATPPSGLPVVDDTLYFTLVLDVGSGAGQICIDSSFIEPAGPWKFSGLTCGQGGEADRPLFVDKYGSDANHPICITVGNFPCQPPVITNLQNGDTLHASYCDNLTFQMLADPGGTSCGGTITGWSVISGVGAIDANGNYQFQGTHDSVYAVIVEVTNDCPSTASISFYVRSPTEMVVPRYQDGLGEHPIMRKLHGVFEKDGVEYVRVWIETDGTNPNFQQDMEEIGVKVEESSVFKSCWHAEIRVDQFQTVPTVPSVTRVSFIARGRESESTGSLLSPTGPMQDSARCLTACCEYVYSSETP